MSFVCLSTRKLLISIQKSNRKHFLQDVYQKSKEKLYHQGNSENINETIVSPVLGRGIESSELYVLVAGPSNEKSPRIDNNL